MMKLFYILLYLIPVLSFSAFDLKNFKIPKFKTCIRDIASIGGSLDSVSYKAFESGSSAVLASSSGIGFKGTWIIFCPREKIELGTYIRLRQFQFEDTKSKNQFSRVPDSISLLSLGGEIKKTIPKFKIEVPIDVELRQEMSCLLYTSPSPRD